LPPEAKDFKKQAAGKAGSENKKNKKALLLVAQSENGARINLAEDDSVSQKEEEPGTSFHKELDQQLSTRTISAELLEASKIIADKDSIIERLRKEKEDLLKQHNPAIPQAQSTAIQQQRQLESELSKRDALIKELKVQIECLEKQLETIKTNDRNEKSAFPSRSTGQHESSITDFELSLPFEDVRSYMMSVFNKNKGLGKVSFHGRLNLKTGRVIAASVGSITEEDDSASSYEAGKV
jgi:hypothetical protein